MQIRKVEILSEVRLADQGQQQAHLILHADGNAVSLTATTTCDTSSTRADLIAGFVHDAIRQISRLPEYRNGQAKITLCDGALPDLAS